MATAAAAPARQIGFWMAVALVMGNMIGSGVFLLPASLASYGGLSLLGWLVSSSGAVCLALVFARLARTDPASGGPYAFTRKAFGDLAGFLVAWGYWISIWCANAALATAFVGYLGSVVPSIVSTPIASAGTAIAAVWVLTAVNTRDVRSAGEVQLVTTVIKIVPLVFIGIAGLIVLDSSHFAVQQTGARAVAGGISSAATLTLFALLGLESATVPAGSIENPSRTIPRATVTGTILAAGIYLLSTAGVMGILPSNALAASTAPFADAAGTLAGSWAAKAVALGAAVSCFGALNGWVLVVGQLPLAVSRDGLFPRVFARLSARGTPSAGLLIAAVLTSAVIAANYSRGLVNLFTFLILLSTLATLVPYAFCSLAVFLIRGAGSRPRGRQMIVPVLAFIYAMWAMAGAGAETVYWGFLLLIAGLPVYVWGTSRGQGVS